MQDWFEQPKVPPMPDLPDHQAAFGLAALSICESLLVALHDLRIIGEQEVVGILKDASAAHHNAEGARDPKAHTAAAAVIDCIIAAKNSVRHG
jgi:hypothetical protein